MATTVIALRPGIVLASLLVIVSKPAPAGGTSATAHSQNAEVALISDVASIQPGKPFRVGLRMKLKRGWHTYWKQPGDAGLPLRVEWVLPSGFTAGPIEWPTPERIPTGELMSYGYGRDVLLATTITPPARMESGSVAIAGAFDWLECKEACVSASAELGVTIPVEATLPKVGSAAGLFAEARARSPGSAEGWSLGAMAGPRAIEVSFRPPPGVTPTGAYFFVDQPLVVEHGAAQGFERAGERYRVTATPAANAAGPPRRITGVLVVEGAPGGSGALAVDVEAAHGDPAPASPPAPARTSWPAVVYGLGVVVLAAVVLVLRIRRGPAGA